MKVPVAGGRGAARALALALALCATSLAPPASGAPAGAPGRTGGPLVPASADGALFLDGAAGGEGLRELLGAAAAFAPALQPEEVSAVLSERVAVDLLTSSGSSRAGLSASGVRALVFSGPADGLSAPVGDAALAGRTLAAWLAAPGAKPRAGAIARVGNSKRLLVASGRGAKALVAALAGAGARGAKATLDRDPRVRAALASAPGPAVLWLRGSGPARAAVLSLRGSVRGLDASGVLVAAGQEAILEGPAPAPDCAGAIACASASLGPAAAPFVAEGASELARRALPGAARASFGPLLQRAARALRGPAALRVDGLDAAALTSLQELFQAVSFLARAGAPGLVLAAPPEAPPPIAAVEGGVALRSSPPLCLQAQGGLAWLGAPCPASAPAAPGRGRDGGPSLDARLDTRALESALSRLGPFDALRGDAASGAYALHLLFGPLLSHSGPATLTASPSGLRPHDLHLDLHWPLHQRARPQ